jgi:hypothetical protein
MAGHQREARLRMDVPAIHENKKAGSDPGLFLFATAKIPRDESPRLRPSGCGS